MSRLVPVPVLLRDPGQRGAYLREFCWWQAGNSALPLAWLEGSEWLPWQAKVAKHQAYFYFLGSC